MTGAAAKASPLERLCALAGIATRYHDGQGRDCRPTDHDLRALLRGLRIQADDEAAIAAAIACLEAADWQDPLPPVVTCRQGAQLPGIPLTLPSAARERPLSWHLDLENGGRLVGQVTPSDLPLAERRTLKDTAMERRLLRDLPELPLGYHRFWLQGRQDPMALIVAPQACHLPQALKDTSERYRGITLQLYALRSDRNWGIGDFSDLKQLGRAAAAQGADFIGINPLHARPLLSPPDVSPYAASSRFQLDPIYIDVAGAAEEFGSIDVMEALAAPLLQEKLGQLRALAKVDYAAVGRLKRDLLLQLYHHFSHAVLLRGGDKVADYSRFLAEQGAQLAHFASFEAAREASLVRADDDADNLHPADAGFHSFLQWVAARQLAEVQADLRAAGMRIGLYRDLAVGPAPDGAEAAAFGQVFAEGVSPGAPADAFSASGQCWNLRAFAPRALRDLAYGPFISLLRQNFAAAGALRIDHVMGLQRLFWVPEGRDGRAGSYVTYPLEDLLAVLALESHRAEAMVIGEDLGTVPLGFRQTLAAENILRYHVLLFEREEDGRFRMPSRYDRLALATPATHDTATLQGYFDGRDIDARLRCGLISSSQAAAMRAEREEAKTSLKGLFDALGLRTTEDRASCAKAAAHSLEQAPSALMAYQLDDLLGETEAVNLPGSGEEAGNWRRKYGVSLEQILAEPTRIALTP